LVFPDADFLGVFTFGTFSFFFFFGSTILSSPSSGSRLIFLLGLPRGSFPLGHDLGVVVVLFLLVSEGAFVVELSLAFPGTEFRRLGVGLALGVLWDRGVDGLITGGSPWTR
jgi:hypothetical protein